MRQKKVKCGYCGSRHKSLGDLGRHVVQMRKNAWRFARFNAGVLRGLVNFPERTHGAQP